MPPSDLPTEPNRPSTRLVVSNFSGVHDIHEVFDVSAMHKTYRDAYAKVSKIQKRRIDMATFTKYTDLPTDIRNVENKIANIRASDRRLSQDTKESIVLGEVLEAILFDTVRQGLLGSEVKPIMPSLYDDLYEGTDLILEYSRDGFVSYTSMGIDVTVSEEGSLKKLEALRGSLLKGQLGRVKYFASPDGNYTGSIDNVPKFIVGLDRTNLFQFTDAWVKNSDVHDEHVRAILLGQIKIQCEYFVDLIQRKIAKTSDEYTKSKLGKVLDVYVVELKKTNGLMERLKVTPVYDDGLSKLMLSYKQTRNKYGDQLPV